MPRILVMGTGTVVVKIEKRAQDESTRYNGMGSKTRRRGS